MGTHPCGFLPLSCSSCPGRCSPRSLKSRPAPKSHSRLQASQVTSSPGPDTELRSWVLGSLARNLSCPATGCRRCWLVLTVCLLDCMRQACLEGFTEISPLLARIAMEGELVNDITDKASELYRGSDTQCVHLVLIPIFSLQGLPLCSLNCEGVSSKRPGRGRLDRRESQASTE